MTLTAGEIGGLLRSGTRTAVEIAAETLAAVEEWQPSLNAFVTVTRERALDEARAVDDALARGTDLGPLMGVPYGVKDILAADGAPTTGGSAALLDYRPGPDAEVVARLRRAGAVLVGKTNLHELGWGFAPEIGAVNNPLDVRLTAGGSSGGSAAAVGCGAVPVAIGTDAGGSIRIPAAFCGVVGLKPTFGRVPHDGKLPGGWSLGHTGPLARTVADAAAVFACIADRSARRSELPERPTVAVLAGSVGSAKETIADSLGRALAALEAEGWTIVERDLAEGGATAAWSVTFATELRAALEPWLRDRLDLLSDDLRQLIALGARIPAHAYVTAQRHRSRLAAVVDTALEGVDALAMPTVIYPPTVGELEWGDESYLGNNRWLLPFNLTGHPALTLPLAPPASGAALQLVGPVDLDETLLALGARAEAVLAAAADSTTEAPRAR